MLLFRKEDYEKYFNELGVTNIVIHPEKFVDIPPDANYLEEVIAVFATPPNSYSAVADPVDLVSVAHIYTLNNKCCDYH